MIKVSIEGDNYYKHESGIITVTGDQYAFLKQEYIKIMEKNFEVIINKVLDKHKIVVEVNGGIYTIINNIGSINWHNEVLESLNLKALEPAKNDICDLCTIEIL